MMVIHLPGKTKCPLSLPKNYYPNMAPLSMLLPFSSDNKDETILLKLKVGALLTMTTIEISHESSTEKNKLIHLSSYEILISRDNK